MGESEKSFTSTLIVKKKTKNTVSVFSSLSFLEGPDRSTLQNCRLASVSSVRFVPLFSIWVLSRNIELQPHQLNPGRTQERYTKREGEGCRRSFSSSLRLPLDLLFSPFPLFLPSFSSPRALFRPHFFKCSPETSPSPPEGAAASAARWGIWRSSAATGSR